MSFIESVDFEWFIVAVGRDDGSTREITYSFVEVAIVSDGQSIDHTVVRGKSRQR